ncbi:unnamed protein product [Adineta steineri]|uniref:Uncharacterized protein n=2 Tax=Adineta steineri TaxID=433720 RepID=A0A814LTC1_9BILA|nr:unnamed protein product [Adineta steineri]CAF1125733.1 unnamed protein product [Adineta steineri]CAF1199021.1 unnamed protein product [Adineta steineri]CAF3784187.1 unnamed protein product [Adineta steineri]CAF4223061.1 unnamed protein product [Adineta steineri]
MSPSIFEKDINQNDLLDNIFNHNNDKFYNYIKRSYRDNLAGSFSFQAIGSGLHLVQTSCDAILLIFQQESEDIN